jgi:GNAT superfamily N-acetyltransferase
VSSIAYRKATAADMPFVVDSFLESFRTAHAGGLIVMSDWKPVMRRQLALMLSRPGSEVWVAYHPGEDVADLYGWIALWRAERPLVLYVYVKQAYRRLGVARGLFGAAGIDLEGPFDYAAKTGVVTSLAPKMPRARWNPLRARFTDKKEPA